MIIWNIQLFGGRGGKSSVKSTLSRTDRMVNRITGIVQDWVADSYMDEDDKENVTNWHDLLEQLGMTAREAREDIMETLQGYAWDYIMRRPGAKAEDVDLQFDDDGSFDTGTDYMKYGDVMKLVKQNLARLGVMKRGN